jgi:hypothetical protein
MIRVAHKWSAMHKPTEDTCISGSLVSGMQALVLFVTELHGYSMLSLDVFIIVACGDCILVHSNCMCVAADS